MIHALRFQLEDIVCSQPTDTGTDIHVNTQLVYAIEHLKVSYNRAPFPSSLT